jgi:recombination protein RecR
MSARERLADHFTRFPGIGPRQAARFVAFLARSSPAFVEAMARDMITLRKSVKECSRCGRFHEHTTEDCSICTNTSRDHSTIMVVRNDQDVEAVERSGLYTGTYFLIRDILDIGEESQLPRMQKLIERVNAEKKKGSVEVIIGLAATPSGDYTAGKLINALSSDTVTATKLARGISTGLELEYADPESLRGALSGRH